MYARNISFRLKSNMQSDYMSTLENQILPLLRKQKGFKDEIAFVGSNGAEAVSISMWDRKESADAYARDTYPAVLKSLDKVVQGTPKVDNYEVSNSTFHKIAAR